MPFQLPWYRKQVETKQQVLGLTEELGSFFVFGQNTASTPTAALRLYELSTAVSVPINKIVAAFKIMEPILLVGDKRTDHEVIEFLKNPSPYFSLELFFENMAKDYLITGETWIVGLGGVTRPPIEIQTVTPKAVTVPHGTDGTPAFYDVTGLVLPGQYKPKRKGNTIRYYNGGLLEIKQIRNYSTKDSSMLRGQSKLVSAAKEARQHILGGEHNVSLLEKGGRVSLVFHFKTDMDDEDYEDAKARVNAQWGGSTKAGMIGVTAGEEMEIKDIGSTNKDMDFAVLHKLAQKSIALQFDVPLPLITDERQTLNNYREGRLALYDDAVIPLSKILFGGLGSFLLPRFGLDPSKARISFDPDQISALVSRRNDEMLKRTQARIETDNELRALITREPIDGGDVLYKPSSEVPIGTDLFLEDNDLDVVEPEVN
jgi:HK97 family phage portal protein